MTVGYGYSVLRSIGTLNASGGTYVKLGTGLQRLSRYRKRLKTCMVPWKKVLHVD